MPTNHIDESHDGSDIEDSHFTFRAKWMLDGCRNLDEVIKRLEEEIDYIKELRDDGWELKTMIEDDWGFLHRITENSDKEPQHCADDQQHCTGKCE